MSPIGKHVPVHHVNWLWSQVGCEGNIDDGMEDGYMIWQFDGWRDGIEEDCKEGGLHGWELGHDVANVQDCLDDFRLIWSTSSQTTV